MGKALARAWWQQRPDCKQRRRRQDGEASTKLSSQDGGDFQVVTSAVFACVGTAGQRCTTLRRLIVHEDLFDEVIQVSLVSSFYASSNETGAGETEEVLCLDHGQIGGSP